jgi:murein DD-endopeptidase MepM/ murein hydrolase activator NlpD
VRPFIVAAAVAAALALPAAASAYGWPLKPFDKPHPIRGSFGDPRYHLGPESSLSSFHFGVDISARDGQAVYSVSGGYVHAYSAHLTVTSHTSREYGYWHVKPVVRTGTWVKPHQLIAHVITGWGHVHFAERYQGKYKDPLRKRALTPYYDKTTPVVENVHLLRDDGSAANAGSVTGALSVTFGAWDAPQVAPPSPWDVARLAPAELWWMLTTPDGSLVASSLIADFSTGLPQNSLYSWIYAPGTYQNKPHRPGNYVYWAMHSFDTSVYPDGRYELTLVARDDRGNTGSAAVGLQFANGNPGLAVGLGPTALEHR